jgi:hypothetical protein
MINKPIPKGYKDEHYPPIPTRTRKFLRKCWLFQIIRFFVLNLKIMRIVVGGHN